MVESDEVDARFLQARVIQELVLALTGSNRHRALTAVEEKGIVRSSVPYK